MQLTSRCTEDVKEFDAKINGPRTSRSKGKAKAVSSVSEDAGDAGDESDEASAKPNRVGGIDAANLAGTDVSMKAKASNRSILAFLDDQSSD